MALRNRKPKTEPEPVAQPIQADATVVSGSPAPVDEAPIETYTPYVPPITEEDVYL